MNPGPAPSLATFTANSILGHKDLQQDLQTRSELVFTYIKTQKMEKQKKGGDRKRKARFKEFLVYWTFSEEPQQHRRGIYLSGNFTSALAKDSEVSLVGRGPGSSGSGLHLRA